jgi:hypothetical protein
MKTPVINIIMETSMVHVWEGGEAPGQLRACWGRGEDDRNIEFLFTGTPTETFQGGMFYANGVHHPGIAFAYRGPRSIGMTRPEVGYYPRKELILLTWPADWEKEKKISLCLCPATPHMLGSFDSMSGGLRQVAINDGLDGIRDRQAALDSDLDRIRDRLSALEKIVKN